MKTKQIVQASAQVVEITNLQKGDVYKRMEDGRNSSSHYGVVTDVLNDGEGAFIESVEYKKDWGEVKAEFKVFGGNDDVHFFPVKPQEIEQHFSDMLSSLEEKVEDKQKELGEAKRALKGAKNLLSDAQTNNLSEPEHKVIGN